MDWEGHQVNCTGSLGAWVAFPRKRVASCWQRCGSHANMRASLTVAPHYMRALLRSLSYAPSLTVALLCALSYGRSLTLALLCALSYGRASLAAVPHDLMAGENGVLRALVSAVSSQVITESNSYRENMKILPIPVLTILPVAVMATVLCGCHATTAVEASSTRHPVVAPAGSVLRVRLSQTLDSGRSRPGVRFKGVLDSPLLCGSDLVLPKGTVVDGRVIAAKPADQSSTLAVELLDFQAGTKLYPIAANVVTRTTSSAMRHATLEADSIIGFTLSAGLRSQAF